MVKKKKINPQIVAAAIIERDGHILIGKRKQGKWYAGNWEFPGGTLEEGETYQQCLKRELQEELTVTSEVGELICSSEYVCAPDWTIKLFAYRATVVSGTPSPRDHEELRWVQRRDLVKYGFSTVSRSIAERLAREDRWYRRGKTWNAFGFSKRVIGRVLQSLRGRWEKAEL